MAIKNALRLRSKITAAADELTTLYSEYVDYHKIYCIQQVAWEIDAALSNGNSRARLFIEGHGYKHFIEEQASPAANNLYTYSDPIWLIPRERLAVEFDEAAEDAIAEMLLTGYWTELKEGIV